MVNVEEHLSLVKFTIKKYFIIFDQFDYEEKYQIGCIGLIKAAKNFDDTLGIKFSHYAIIWIKGEITNYLKGDKWKIGSREERLSNDAKVPISLETPISCSSENDTTLIDTLGTSGRFENVEIMELLNGILDKREKEIIVLNVLHGYPQARISKVLGVSQMQVSRIKLKALGKLRELLIA